MCDFIELIDTLRWYWSSILRHALEISVNLSQYEKQVMEKIAEKSSFTESCEKKSILRIRNFINTLVEQR